MKTDMSSLNSARRASIVLVVVSLLSLTVASSRAHSPAHFASVQSQIHQDIATVASLPSPTRTDRLLLRALHRGSNALTKTSIADGRMLRSLNSILGRRETYRPALSGVASNLLTGFNAEQAFIAHLLPELPDFPAATAVKALFQKFAPTSARLNAAQGIAKFAGKYDVSKRKLDDLLFRANQASLIPFPVELPENSVFALINGVNFRTSRGATENVFSAAATETNLSVVVSGVAISSGSRGLLFSLPDVQPGAFRYAIPGAASFTNRAGIYPPDTESNAGATNGAIFINATTNEVYGSFSCSGPGFNITGGSFRITISRQP